MSNSSNPKATNDNSGDRGTKVTMVRTYPVLQNTDGRGEPYWLERIREFRALEIVPHALMREPGLSYFEPCRAIEADSWIVIGRYPSGHIEHCENFTSEAEASAFRDHLIACHTHLILRDDWNTARMMCSGRAKAPPAWRVMFFPASDARGQDSPPQAPFFRICPGDDAHLWVAQTNSDLPPAVQEEFALLIADALSKLLL